MKFIRTCLIFGLSISLTGCRNIKQQNKTPLAENQSTQADSHNNEIRRINNFVHAMYDHKYSFTIEKEILGTDDGGQLTGYYDGHVLTKIDVWLGMSNNTWTQQFYFENGHLIFVKETRNFYLWDENKGEVNRSQFSETKEEKYYFHHGNLIQHSGNDKDSVAESEIISVARTYIKFLSMKEKTVYVNQ